MVMEKRRRAYGERSGRQAHREAESGEEEDHKESRERAYLLEICKKNLV